ncbi:MAG: hypothetical protein WAP57_13050 [Aquabacterium commune]|uniref:hypothetical protein n=1 Tax=Aquabacterium commune TaxID=70586 RepID=UPI003BAF3260
MKTIERWYPSRENAASTPLLAEYGGRFVTCIRLPDLVHLVAGAHTLPLQRALQLVHDTLSERTSVPLLLDRGNGEATPVTDSETVDAHTMERSADARADGWCRADSSADDDWLGDTSGWLDGVVPARDFGSPAKREPHFKGRAWALAAFLAAPDRAAAVAVFKHDAEDLFSPLAEADTANVTALRVVPQSLPALDPVPVPWTDARLAARRKEIEEQTPKVKAPMVQLLREAEIEDTPANRKSVQRRIGAASSDGNATMGQVATTLVRDGKRVSQG